MTLTAEMLEKGWKLHDGSDVCPIKDNRTVHQIMEECGWTSSGAAGRETWSWRPVIAYRIIEAHGADAEPAIVMQGLSDDRTGLGRFGHHPDPAIDFCVEVECLQSRLHQAQHGLSKPGDDPEPVSSVLADIQRAMTFQVGGDEGAVAAKQLLRELEREAHGADAEPARPTPFPASYDELVFDQAGWSQTIIVDGKRPEWLRDDDVVTWTLDHGFYGYVAAKWHHKDTPAIRVRRREPKRETIGCEIWSNRFRQISATIDLIDGEPDLSTIKIGSEA